MTRGKTVLFCGAGLVTLGVAGAVFLSGLRPTALTMSPEDGWALAQRIFAAIGQDLTTEDPLTLDRDGLWGVRATVSGSGTYLVGGNPKNANVSVSGGREYDLRKSGERRAEYRFTSAEEAGRYCDEIAAAAFGGTEFRRTRLEFLPRDERDGRGWLVRMASATALYHRVHRGYTSVSGADGLSLQVDAATGAIEYAYWQPDPFATSGSATPTVSEQEARRLAEEFVQDYLHPEEIRGFPARLGWAAQYDPVTRETLPSYVLAWHFTHPDYADRMMDWPAFQDSHDQWHVGSVRVSATGSGKVW
ncbi:MAG: hypothetical protein IT207_07345 [Fimbriimonadaceae bacterium]|nr:hypothetical protein [Fimbriimonadaceae bacterium]